LLYAIAFMSVASLLMTILSFITGCVCCQPYTAKDLPLISPDPVMAKRVALSYVDDTIMHWSFPSETRETYVPAPSEPTGRRYLYTTMVIESRPHRDLHYMRASLENQDPLKVGVHNIVKQVMGLDDAALAAGVAAPRPKDELPADGEVGGMPFKIDLALACPKHEKGMRLSELDERFRLSFTKRPDLLCYTDPAARDASRAYFAKEVAVMDMLHDKPHDNIVKCLGIGVKEGYIVSIELEFHPSSLGQRCADKTRPLDIDIGKCIKGIADALVHLHDLGYCHNDVKPDNIVLKTDGTPVLIDFDSCLPINQVLGKGTTKGWGDEDSKISCVKNDWLGLALVEEHLRKACLANLPK